MNVKSLRKVNSGFLTEWEGVTDDGRFVTLRWKRDTLELRCNERHRH